MAQAGDQNSSYSSLLEAFEALNERKRWHPESMDQRDWDTWKALRREIDEALFQRAPGPEAEKRVHLRVPVTFEVRYWTQNELKDRYIPILGEGGLFVSSVDPLETGTRLDLELVLAQKNLSIRVKAEVVWIRNSPDPARRGMGVKFVEMTDEQKKLIYDLVDDSLRRQLMERRMFARIDAALKVEFVYAEGHLEELTRDISRGGLFISTSQPVPVGESIRLILHLPGRQPGVQAVARVVRVVEASGEGEPAGMGVRFEEMNREGRQALERFLGRQASGESIPAGRQHERRKHARMKHRVKLRFQALSSFSMTYCHDIGRGGVFIFTRDAPPEGSQVKVNLVHPATLQILELAGMVVRVSAEVQARAGSPGVAVVFDEMDETKQNTLRTFLRDFALLKWND